MKFIATGVWTGTITLPGAIGFGETIGGGITLPADGETTILGALVKAGDYVSLTFDGTVFYISGIGATAAYLTLTA